ncbi:MAG TPA: hypothetical protein VFS60_12110 [Thermoanaerobaculia bacterium]|nr:hypothetical protein [Thermoanaerobaculia bacterium]
MSGANRAKSRVRVAVAVAATALLAVAAVAANGGRPHPHPRVHVHPSTAGWRAPGSDYPAAARDRTEQSFQLPAGAGKVVVDNVAGNVRARAVDGDTVRIVAVQQAHATSAANLEVARREMPLRLSQHGDTVIAFVDSPFRDERGRLQGPWDDLPYRVLYDVEVEVPRRAAVELSTVLDGDVELAGTDGAFLVRNVNGAVGVRDVGGAGKAITVNGELAVRFRRNPNGPCEFGNVNGDVDVTFQPGLAAEVRFKTLNGEGWSDFPYTLVPLRPEVSESRRDGRYVIKSDWSQGIRIGNGGPQLSFGTVNGDVLIRKAT